MLCYLSFVGIKDIGTEGLDAMLITLPRATAAKTVGFMAYAWDPDALTSWIGDAWNLLYDNLYVERQLMNPAQENYPAIIELINDMAAKLEFVGIRPAAAKTTTPKPFKLTLPKPKTIRVPRPAPAAKKHMPVPKSTYKLPIEVEALERKKRINKQRAVQALHEAGSSGVVQRGMTSRTESVRTKQLRQTLEHRELAETQVQLTARPLPSTLNKPVSVKLNAGAILREEKHFRELADREARRLKEVEAGAFNSDEFIQWEAAQYEAEEQRKLEEIEVRHLQGLISREEAVIARQEQAERNAEEVLELREKKQEMLDRYLDEQIQQGKLNRELVLETNLLYERVQKAKEEDAKAKTAIGKSVEAETKKLLQEAKAREVEEMAVRLELIQQIRALESMPIDRTKVVDLTETSGFGFLTEMSFIELRERLALLKVREERDEANRREEINRKKKEAENALAAKVESIAIARAERQHAAVNKKKPVGKVVAQKPTDRVAELKAKLAAKKRATKPIRASRVSKNETFTTFRQTNQPI